MITDHGRPNCRLGESRSVPTFRKMEFKEERLTRITY